MPAPIDIDALLEPLSPAAPCGENLEYTPEFAAMLAAVAGKPEQQLGEAVVAAVAPAWDDVAERCQGLLATTRDLRVAVRLTQALLHLHGLPGLGAGLRLTRGWIDCHWNDLHPRLDPDDGFDPAIRLTAVALLCNLAAIVHPLRDATPLLQGAAGHAITLRHVQEAHGDEGASPGVREIDEAGARTDVNALRAAAAAAHAARTDARAIDAALAAQAGAAFTMDFEPLHKALGEIDDLMTAWLARREPPPEEPADAAPAPAADDTGLPPVAAPAARPPRAPLASRADAMRVLDDLCRWFHDHEPSHPVPILLERARRWIEMDFMDLLRDVAPEAVAEAQKLHGAMRPQ
jgi:type VI secretion system protein ImpA